MPDFLQSVNHLTTYNEYKKQSTFTWTSDKNSITMLLYFILSCTCSLITYLYEALLLKFFSNVEVILSNSIVLLNVDTLSGSFFSTCSLKICVVTINKVGQILYFDRANIKWTFIVAFGTDDRYKSILFRDGKSSLLYGKSSLFWFWRQFFFYLHLFIYLLTDFV